MKIIMSNKNEKDRSSIDKIKTYYGQKTESKAVICLINDFDRIQNIIDENKSLKIKLATTIRNG